MRKMKKGALLAALSGATLFGFGGCLNTGQVWKTLWQGAGLTVGGDLVDAFVMDGLLLGQDVNNAVQFGTAFAAACNALPTAAEVAACLTGQRP